MDQPPMSPQPQQQPVQPVHPQQPPQPYPQAYPPPMPPQQPMYPAQQPYPQQQQPYPQQVATPPAPVNSPTEKPSDSRLFRRLLLVATVASIVSTVAFVLYVLAPRATAAQLAHAHPYYLAGLVGLAIAEACQILGILVLIGHWASHYNTERRLREILILIVALIPYMVVVIFLWTLIVYLRARRHDPASKDTQQAKQELKEETVNTLIDAGTNRSSALAGSQAPVVSVTPARPTLGDTVGRVIGPSTRRNFSEAGNWLVSFTMVAVVLATVATLGAVTPLNRLAANNLALGTPTVTTIQPTSAPVTSAPGTIQGYHLPGDGEPTGVALGPDGNLWFTASSVSGPNIVGKITPSGVITEFPLTATSGDPSGITKGPDGNLWFTESGVGSGRSSAIGRMTTSGQLTEFPVSSGDYPDRISSGPDGNLWFTESAQAGAGLIGRITPAGSITEFKPAVFGNPTGITVGPDGNLWYTLPSGLNTSNIGRTTPGGVSTAFPVTGGLPIGITAGPDGALWFTEGYANFIGRITTSGAMSTFNLPTRNADYGPIVVGPNGNLWFTLTGEYAQTIDANQIGEISPAGAVQVFKINATGEPEDITVGPDGNLWFTESGTDAEVARITSTPITQATETPTP
ncbi:MAG TPA: hypothetical protein VF120_10875 [Ktedonobacterales bacterium]